MEHGTHDPEEFPFLEEQSILRRLEATLFSLRNWSVTRSKFSLNNWQVKDFVLITQGDLLNTKDCYTLLQVGPRPEGPRGEHLNFFVIYYCNTVVEYSSHEEAQFLKCATSSNTSTLGGYTCMSGKWYTQK